MKLSQFNNQITYSDKTIIYNSLTDRYLIADPFLIDLITASGTNNEVSGLEEYHPSLFKALEKDGFIINQEKDEIEAVREVMARVDQDDSNYHLVINPTMNCNFKCWYCYETHIKGSKMNIDVLENIIKHLENVICENGNLKSISISWFGGEPLLYYQDVILPILKRVKVLTTENSLNFYSDFTTNGLLIKERMIRDFINYNCSHFQITLDGNRFLHDTVRFVSKSRGSYDDIIKNVQALCSAGIYVSLRINYTKTNLTGLEEIADDLIGMDEECRSFLTISFHKVWQEKDKNLDTRVIELLSYFKKKGFITKGNFVPDTLKNSCYADKKNHATINYDGNVFKCTARDFNKENREGELDKNGRINWNEKYSDRMHVKLKNKPCLTCSILPLCNGGCSQIALEAEGKDFCVFEFDEKLKNEIVYRKFLETMGEGYDN